MIKSLYGQYIEERAGKSIIENEIGFVTYCFTQEFCYIEEVFVLKSHRKAGTAAEFCDVVAAEAKEKGYNKLLGSVCPSAVGSTASIQVLLSCGFKLLSSENNLIYFTKDI